MPDDLTHKGAVAWQIDSGWAFFFQDKVVRRQVIHMCRSQLGRGHHVHSAWYGTHAVPPNPGPDWQYRRRVPVIIVKDPHMVIQLKLTYT
jgi:hypothetical protein